MPNQINQEQAAALWSLFGVTVSKVRIAPKQHKGNVLFIGYADIHVWLFTPGEEPVGIPLVTLVGNSIKLIAGQVHFDPKSEQGKGARATEYFPSWRPMSPEARAVLTSKLAEDPDIINMIEGGQAQINEAANAAG